MRNKFINLSIFVIKDKLFMFLNINELNLQQKKEADASFFIELLFKFTAAFFTEFSSCAIFCFTVWANLHT